ncbi:4'-phosphopantetheinyl transferase family protein [Marinobacter sp. es.042]|uniref:4'-phosphopantetheinyl transferase family protein n=1 Tax=Marinobacter sp. es.042 TaxID=1761794 RepID=UPI0012F95361|nr:4'-phosphopantetheinyl transferase superfamily protein [Marinobacter sp. es.042]
MTKSPQPHEYLTSRMPNNVIIRTTTECRRAPSIFLIEEAYISNAIEKRKSEFRTGRYLARQALMELGISSCPIPPGKNREPLWPNGTSGSISHCDSLIVAVAASNLHYRSIGVDVELNKPLPIDVAELILSSEEAENNHCVNGVKHLETLIFSAKESVFKCIFPMAGVYFDFHEVALQFDQLDRFFTALLPLRIAEKVGFREVIGQYTIDNSHIFTLTHIKV